MKAFVIKSLYFFSIPILIGSLVLSVNYTIQKQVVELELKKISEYENVIMGDSQMQRLNPNLFEDETYNFASSGEHYYVTYHKIKSLLGFKNHKIKKVILGVSLPNFAPAYNRLFDLNSSEGQNSLERYLYFMNLNDTKFLKPKGLLKKNVFESAVKGIFMKPDWGGLFVSHVENPDSLTINKIFDIHYGIKKNENVISEEQIKYLIKIEQLCKENSIDLYVLTCPIHTLYKKKVDSRYYDVLRNTILSLKNAKYINYLNDSVSPNWMSDPVHLNSKGADAYSKMINDSINIKSIIINK